MTGARRIPRAALLLLGLMALGVSWDRVRVLDELGFRYTDHDQAIYWTAAYEASQVRFHEPRFYGQPYHHYLDAVLAAPIIRAGLPVHRALPVVATTISLAPFFLLAACALRRRLVVSALAILALPLLLPPEYALITSMPRGFTTGILLAAIAAVLALGELGAGASFGVGFLLVLSISLVPNAAIVAVPIGFYAWTRNLRSRRLYLSGGLGALLALGLHLASDAFYALHPENVVFPPAGHLAFSWSALGERLSRLGDFWGPVSPATLFGPWLVLMVLVLEVAAAWLLRTYRVAAAILLGGLLLIASLGIAHVGVGSLSIFYPYARMFLAVPLLLLLGVFWLEAARGPWVQSRRALLMVAVGSLAVTTLFLSRRDRLPETIEAQLATPSNHGVVGRRVELVENGCARLAEIAGEARAELVVFAGFHEIWAYSCEVISDKRFGTLLLQPLVGDRRTWRLEEEVARNPRKLVLFGIGRRAYLAGEAMGAKFGPPHEVHGSRVVAVELPEEARLLEFLHEMGVEGARQAAERLGN